MTVDRRTRIHGRFRFSSAVRAIVASSVRFETLLIAVLLLATSILGPGEAQASPSVPSGFGDELVASVGSPTDITFTPGGRLVVSTQGGVLYIKSGSSLVTALDLSGVVCSDFERGMLGVTFDPDFGSNNYIYIFYTFNKFNTCADNSANSPVNRVSRFTMSGNTVNAASEVVLVDNMPSPNGNHNAGDLVFGKDGYLYISIGDGGCELNNSSFCGGQNRNALKTNVLTGKVLRISRDGGIPASNPFRGSDSEPCASAGKTTTSGKTKCQETYLWGLRNPFRIATDPNANGTRLYVNDVGQNVWEEIDEAVAGANYGWNTREGFCPNGSTSGCGAPPSGLTNPVFAYQHDGCNSITGGAFVPNGIWPSQYDGSYLYADYVCGKIFRLKNGTSTLFASNLGPVTTLQFGPYGSGQALYYASYAGEIRRITTNRNPIAVATADPSFGLTPLTVAFDGTGSSDPDNNSLTYQWDFKDSSPLASGATVNHTFTTNGVYQVSLKVTDSGGAFGVTTVKVDVGNTPPAPAITSPLVNDRFSVGETITLQGSATDPQEGSLPNGSLSWEVKLHHDQHEHPLFSGTGNNLQFEAPAPEDLLAASNSYLVVNLTATDSTGLSTTVSQNLLPNKVDLTVNSAPAGLSVQIEGLTFVTPAVVETWAGNTVDLFAPDQLLPSGEAVEWESWTPAGNQSFQYEMPETDATVTANYELLTAPSFIPVADARVREGSPNSNEGSVAGLTSKGGTTTDYESFLRFDVTGLSGSVTSATLYLYAYEGTSNGPSVYKTSSGWTEMGVTWANRPRSSGGKLDDAGAIPNGSWFSLDVTGAITGNGSFNLLLRSTSTDAVSMRSREAESNPPRLVIRTNGGAGDTTAPSTPTGLTSDAPESGKVILNWNASTDDNAVTGYDIFRNGTLVTSTQTNSFVDLTVKPSRQYSYQVRARDAASNVSGLSTASNVSTPAPTATLTFIAKADTYAVESSPSTNFGRRTTLRVEGGTDPDTISFLNFTVNGLPGAVYRSTLRVFVPAGSGNGSSDGPELHRTTSNWVETAVLWTLKPAITPSKVGDVGAITAGTWVEYDVSAIVSSNRSYGWALVSISTDLAVFSSREGANPPQLVITAFVTGPTSIQSASDEVVTPVPTPIPTTTPVETLPIFESFEGDEWTDWEFESGFAVTDAIAKTGSKSAVSRSKGSNEAPGKAASATKTLPESAAEIFVKSEVYVDRRGPNNVNLITLKGANSTPLVSVIVDADGKAGIVNERTGVISPVTEIDQDRWYEIQIHLISDGSNSRVELWIDGELVYQDRQKLSRREIAAVTLGDSATDRTFTVAFDDIVIDRSCVGRCSSELVATPTETAVPTSTPATEETSVATVEVTPTETPVPTLEPTQEPTLEPTPEPTETPDPTPEAPPTDEPTSEAGG